MFVPMIFYEASEQTECIGVANINNYEPIVEDRKNLHLQY